MIDIGNVPLFNNNLIVFEIVLFVLCLTFIFFSRFILNKLGDFINSKNYTIFNPNQYLPEGELQTLKQLSYLLVAGAFITDLIYQLATSNADFVFLQVFDVFLSIAGCIIILSKFNKRRFILVLFLNPVVSIILIVLHVVALPMTILASIWYILHLIALLIVTDNYVKKFFEYTQNNNLGLTILLLFFIIIISIFITCFVENVNLLDSMVMVSNAFTSNGYSILGSSTIGKIDAIFLVWGGYILSGVGTATLASAIVIKVFRKRIKDIESHLKEESKKNEELNEKIDELKELIVNQNKK